MSFVSWFNNPSPSAAYMRQWIRSALVRMMACCLFAPGLYLGQCWVIVNWNRFQFVSCFNHFPIVPHICVSESGQHWFGWRLVAYSAPGLCLGQCWVTVNWNRLLFVFCFNHLLLVPRICVSESGQHWFGWWLVAYSRQAFVWASAGLLSIGTGFSLYLVLIISPYCRIYASVNRFSIVSDDGLSPTRRQAFVWASAGLLSIGTDFNLYFVFIISS